MKLGVLILYNLDQRLLVLFNVKKNLPNPPRYINDLKDYLKIVGLIDENDGEDSSCQN